MLDFSKLDSLLASLPEPPKVQTRPKRKRFLFIGCPVDDPPAVYAIKDENHRLVSEHASKIPAGSWNSGVLIGLNMKLSKIVVRRSPEYIQKNGLAYPKTTNVHCYWCRHPFKTQPIGIPYRRLKGQNKYTCFGNYCSYECAMAGSIESRSVQINMFAGSLLCLMRKNISNIPLSNPIHKAPHWSTLKNYGGHLTIQEFRKNSTSIRAIPENLRLFPVGYNLFEESRKVNRSKKKRNTTQLFEAARKRSKIMAKGKKTNYKTNFSHVKLKLKKVQSKYNKLQLKAPKKTKLKLF